MPFHSQSRLTVDVRSCDSKLEFHDASTDMIPYSPDPEAGKEVPYVMSVQRLGAGGAIDKDVWRIREVDDPQLRECAPTLRFFQLAFDGEKYTRRLADKCSDERALALGLYRSLIGEETVRFTLAFPKKGERTSNQKKSPGVLLPLEVDLRYRLRSESMG